MFRAIVLLQLLCLVLVPVQADTRTDTSATYSFGRAPQLSVVKTAKDWQPFIAYLREQTGADIKLRVYETRDKFESELLSGKLDFSYGNPGYFIIAREKNGYMPLIRSSKKKLKGIIVVRKDSPLQDIKQLDKQLIAYPDKSAFAASLYIRSLLKQAGVETTAKYVHGHDNVYRNVANTNYIAGGGVYRTLKREPAALQQTLRVLYETPGMSPHPLTAHPRVPVELQNRLVAAILDLEKSEEGRKMLDKIKIKSPIRADYERDYASVRTFALDMYDYLLK